MAPGNKGQSKGSGSETDGESSSGPTCSGGHAEATDGSDWNTHSCFVASNGRTWSSQYVAMHMHSPSEPQPEVELSQTINSSSLPSQAVVGSGGASNQRTKKKKRKRKKNSSSSASQMAPSSADKVNLSQHTSTPVSSSKATNSTDKRLPQKQARTFHPGEPPTAGATNTSSSIPLVDDTLPDANASLAVPYFLVELDDGEPIPFNAQYGCNLQAVIPQEEVNDSDPFSASRQLLGSDIEPEFSTEFTSFPISFAEVGNFGPKWFEMLSEADSAYCSNQ